jgi:hypothetical protein
MSLLSAQVRNGEPETSGQTLRREIVERAQHAYQRSLRVRQIVVAISVVLSLGQTAYAIAQPGASELPLSDAITWGVPLVSSLFAMGLVWSCRLHLEQGEQQYAAYLRKTVQSR